MGNGRNIEGKNLAITDNRFHFFDMLLYTAYTETVKSQLVHGFEHARMDEVALKANVIIMPHIVRVRCQQLHQKIVAAKGRIDIDIDHGINTDSIYLLFFFCKSIVLR